MLHIQYPEQAEFIPKTEIFLPTEERHLEEQYNSDQRYYYQPVLVYGKLEINSIPKTTNVQFITFLQNED